MGVGSWAFGYGLSYSKDAGSSPFMGVGSWVVNSEGLAMGPTYTTFLFQLPPQLLPSSPEPLLKGVLLLLPFNQKVCP